MDKEKAINLIEKVLAKTNNNSSQHEIEVAMLKAQELLVKYNLTMSDLTLATETEKNGKEVVNQRITKEGKTLWWVKQLSTVIGENFRCNPVVYSGGGTSYLSFIGLREDVEVAQKVFAFAIDSIKYQSSSYIQNLVNEYNDDYLIHNSIKTVKDFNGEKNKYIEGFIKGMREKYKEQVEKNNWGLILVQDNAVTDYVKSMHLKAGRSSNYQSSGDQTHFNNGYKDGKSFEYRNDLIRA